MSFIMYIINVFLHFDSYLSTFAKEYGVFIYIFVFLIVFCETGLVVTPFLPGDSMLFVLGALVSKGEFNLFFTFFILFIAAVLGDSVNYEVGKFFGPKVFRSENSKIFNKEYIHRTEAFFDKHGGKTIIIARFMPIIRTFAPFVAGMGTMKYLRFISFNVIGSFLWVTVLISGGYFFGNIPVIKHNFSLVILAIIFISLLPIIISAFNNRKKKA